VAITLIAFVAGTLTALSFLFAVESRRTRDAVTEAQLQQLLVAGEAAAAFDVERGAERPGAEAVEMKLAEPLVKEGYSVRIARLGESSADRSVWRITARRGDRRRGQRLTFIRHDHGWQLHDAALERP
jgi:hypothetical protein